MKQPLIHIPKHPGPPLNNKPFNPFPATGENDQNQPSSRNVAPVRAFNRGGIPETVSGYKQRFCRLKINTYPLVEGINGIIGTENDLHGQTGVIDIGSMLGVKSPFIFVPEIYSVTLNLVGSLNPVTLNGWSVSLYDEIAADILYTSSPANPANSFFLLGFQFELPILQYDDFSSISRDYLNFLNQIQILNAGMVTSDVGAQELKVTQLLIYRLEDIPL